MNRDGHDNVVFFVGPEVEHTPAFAKRTLFVVGKPELAKILQTANEHKTTHIFMGANHSFSCGNLDPYWDKTITALLDKGFWVSLDYEAHDHQTVLKMLNPGIWQSRIFVPLLSVRIPKIETSSPNLTVKIDDVDFNATNPGVWCMHFHEVTDSNRFTGWDEYGTDVVIKNEVYADINVPAVNLAAIKKQFQETALSGTVEETVSVVQNDSLLGLDPDSGSKLKPDNEEENTTKSEPPTRDVLLQSYVEGVPPAPVATEPLETAKKGKAKVK
jgi:hypothetical protein